MAQEKKQKGTYTIAINNVASQPRVPRFEYVCARIPL